MQAMLSMKYLRRQLGRERERQYYECLASMLTSPAGTNLKAYVCQLFMEERADGPMRVASGKEGDDPCSAGINSLVECAKTQGVFLATYATAALVNLSNGNKTVKEKLMQFGMAEIAVKNINTKDDELIYYTLMLLVNVSKESHHRSYLAANSLIPILTDLLTSSYYQCTDTFLAKMGSPTYSKPKERILTQV